MVGHYGNRSLRKVLTSLHHITSTDNFQIHTTERLRYNTRGTRKRTPYTQLLSTLSKICSDTPRGGYWLYMTERNMRQFWSPFRSLENWYSLTPVCEEKYGNVIRRPPYSSKFGEMFSFYSPFRPFVAFWINGRGWARVWASPSETHQSAPHPGQTRRQTNEISKYVYSDGQNGNCGISGWILPLTPYSLITS